MNTNLEIYRAFKTFILGRINNFEFKIIIQRSNFFLIFSKLVRINKIIHVHQQNRSSTI
jgi:hypothetical protein